MDQLAKDFAPDARQAGQFRILKAEFLSSQAKAQNAKGNPDKAVDLLRESLDLRVEHVAKTGEEFILARGYHDFAELHDKRNSVGDALKSSKKAIHHQTNWVNKKPDDFYRLHIVGFYLYFEGDLHFKQASFTEAKTAYLAAKGHEVKAFVQSKSPLYSKNLELTFRRLYDVQMKLQEYDEAVDTLDEKLKLWPDDFEMHWDAAARLGKVYADSRNQKLLPRILAIFERGALLENAGSRSAAAPRGDSRAPAAAGVSAIAQDVREIEDLVVGLCFVIADLSDEVAGAEVLRSPGAARIAALRRGFGVPQPRPPLKSL